MENDYRTARERVSEERLRRLFSDNDNRGGMQKGQNVNGRRCCGDSLAMVYSPYQNWQNIHDLDSGFCAGTIFKELDKPFLGAHRNGGAFNG